jgi:hypothetical protein
MRGPQTIAQFTRETPCDSAQGASGTAKYKEKRQRQPRITTDHMDKALAARNTGQGNRGLTRIEGPGLRDRESRMVPSHVAEYDEY